MINIGGNFCFNDVSEATKAINAVFRYTVS